MNVILRKIAERSIGKLNDKFVSVYTCRVVGGLGCFWANLNVVFWNQIILSKTLLFILNMVVIFVFRLTLIILDCFRLLGLKITQLYPQID